MRIGIYAVVMSCLLLSFLAAQTASPKIGLQINYHLSRLDPDLGFNSSSGFGGGLSYTVAPNLKVVIDAQGSSSERLFESVGRLDQLTVNINTYQILIEYAALPVTRLFQMSVTAGIGAIQFAQPEQAISLGALGDINLSAKNDIRSVYSLGSKLVTVFGRRIEGWLHPQIQWFSISGLKTNITLRGGVSIAII